MLAIATLLIVVLLSLIVTRVASVALTLTGLSADVAKFQARSALSGTGFATAEAEQITGHPARRQIILALMLFGNAGLVTTIASLSLSFASVSSTGGALGRLGLLIVGLGVLLLLARNEWVSRVMSAAIERSLRKRTTLDVKDYAGLLHLRMDYAVDRQKVWDGEWLAGRTLADAQLSAEGIIVLGVERADGSFLGAPTGQTRMEVGDTLLLYGSAPQLRELADRPAGDAGQAAHDASVAANTRRAAAEQARDKARRRRQAK